MLYLLQILINIPRIRSLIRARTSFEINHFPNKPPEIGPRILLGSLKLTHIHPGRFERLLIRLDLRECISLRRWWLVQFTHVSKALVRLLLVFLWEGICLTVGLELHRIVFLFVIVIVEVRIRISRPIRLVGDNLWQASLINTVVKAINTGVRRLPYIAVMG